MVRLVVAAQAHKSAVGKSGDPICFALAMLANKTLHTIRRRWCYLTFGILRRASDP